MTLKVNGGIITQQILTGSLRYFKIRGTLGWAISDGTINLPLATSGGNPTQTTYFVVGETLPIPNSACEVILREIMQKCTVTIIGIVGTDGTVTGMDIAIENNSMGWGSGTPPYDVPPANTPEDPAAAATDMQTAINALGNITTYSSVGVLPDNTLPPVTQIINLGTVTVAETPFVLA